MVAKLLKALYLIFCGVFRHKNINNDRTETIFYSFFFVFMSALSWFYSKINLLNKDTLKCSICIIVSGD